MSGDKTPKSWANMEDIGLAGKFVVRDFKGKTCNYPVAYIDQIDSLEDLETLATFLQELAKAQFPDIPTTALEGFTLAKIIEEGIKRVGSVIVMDPDKWPKGRDEDFATFEKEMTKAFNDKDVRRRDELIENFPDQMDKLTAKRAKEKADREAKEGFLA